MQIAQVRPQVEPSLSIRSCRSQPRRMRRREELLRDLPELTDLNLESETLLQVVDGVQVDGA